MERRIVASLSPSSAPGQAGIFGFPFRLQGDPLLSTLAGSNGNWRYRLHSPLTVRGKGSPLSPSVPFERWPDFKWSPKVPAKERLPPPTDLGGRFVGERLYDALRIDVWGRGAEVELMAFAKRLLGWLRHFSAQPWIGAIDSHTDFMLKHQFGIDEEGAALETPPAMVSFTTPEAVTKPITNAVWADAFTRACSGGEVPVYWNLFYDAQNSHARQDLRGAILSMALALEVARDINFQRFTSTEFVEGIGLVLKAPFNDTDLLKHLSGRLKTIRSRDLSAEDPTIWKHVREVYVARHHVAHGREPVYPTRAGMRKITPEVYRDWPAAIRGALQWMEGL